MRSFRTKLSFGEMKLLFSVKNYCFLICLIRCGLEKERLYQLSSQIWGDRQLRVAALVFSSPHHGEETFLLQRRTPLLHLQKRLSLQENTVFTNKLTSSSPAHSCFLLASSLSRSHSCSPLLFHSRFMKLRSF